MPGTFAEKTRELEDRVGFGVLSAKVEFNQAYAHRQHEDVLIPPIMRSAGEGLYVPSGQLAFIHPHGGGPKYLEKALFYHYNEYYELLAKGVISWAVGTMIVVGGQFRQKAADNAPIREGHLRDSAEMTVYDHGEPVRIIPGIPRMPQDLIEAINKAVQPEEGHWYGHWPPLTTAWSEMEEAACTHQWETYRKRQMREARQRKVYKTGVGLGVAEGTQFRRRRTGPIRPES